MVCKLCGTENPATNKFCGECGVLLVSKPASDGMPIAPRPDYEPKAEHFASILEPEQSFVVADSAPPTLVYRKEPAVVEPAIQAEPVVVETRPLKPVDHTPLGFEPEGKHYTTISGPSFLGLTDDSPSEADNADYLLEDEEPSGSRAGWIVFSLVAIAILATIGVLEWRAIKTGKLSIPFFSSTSAEAPKTADQPTAASNTSAETTTKPDANSAKPESDQAAPPPADDTKPDQLTTDHGNAGTPPSSQPAASPAPQGASDSDSNAGAAATAAASPDKPAETPTPSKQASAEKPAPAKDTSVEKSAAATTPAVVAKKTKAPREEAVPEKPDPKTNRMLIAGEKYLYGRGVRRDCNQALIYFRAAASEDNGPAMSHLGAMYAAGNCVKIDRATAYSWFVRAQEADPGNEWISRNLNMLWRDMSSQERAAVSR